MNAQGRIRQDVTISAKVTKADGRVIDLGVIATTKLTRAQRALRMMAGHRKG